MHGARRTAEAIVVGAGPAGSVAAFALARRGWRVLLVDRGPRGRAKCCGHCLHPRAVERFASLGLGERVAAASEGPSRRGEVWVAGRGKARRAVETGFDEGGLVIARERLDPILLDAASGAGVAIEHGVQARWSDGGLLLGDERVEPALVVAADGLGSGLARAAGLAAVELGSARRYGFAVDIAHTPPHRWKRERIAMLVADGAYLGVVGHGDGLHCAACAEPKALGGAAPLEVVARFAQLFGELEAALGNGWRNRAGPATAIGPMPWRTQARSTGALALVGDAAGYIEPFTGEGIWWAIESALALAESVDSPGRWDAAARARYEARWQAALARCHARASLVAKLVARPRVVAAFGAVAGFAPGLAARLTDSVRRRLVPR